MEHLSNVFFHISSKRSNSMTICIALQLIVLLIPYSYLKKKTTNFVYLIEMVFNLISYLFTAFTHIHTTMYRHNRDALIPDKWETEHNMWANHSIMYKLKSYPMIMMKVHHQMLMYVTKSQLMIILHKIEQFYPVSHRSIWSNYIDGRQAHQLLLNKNNNIANNINMHNFTSFQWMNAFYQFQLAIHIFKWHLSTSLNTCQLENIYVEICSPFNFLFLCVLFESNGL